MINLDAFYLTHTSEPVQVPDQEAVDAFIPKRLRPLLDTENPVTFGNVCGPESVYVDPLHPPPGHSERVGCLDEAPRRHMPPLSAEPVRLWKATGSNDADTVLMVVIGSASGALKLAVDQLRLSRDTPWARFAFPWSAPFPDRIAQ